MYNTKEKVCISLKRLLAYLIRSVKKPKNYETHFTNSKLIGRSKMRNIVRKTHINGKTVYVKNATRKLNKKQIGKNGLIIEIPEIKTIEWLIEFSQEIIAKGEYNPNLQTPKFDSIVFVNGEDKNEITITLHRILQEEDIYQLNYYEYEKLKMIVATDSLKIQPGVYDLVYPSKTPFFVKPQFWQKKEIEARAISALVKAAEVYLAVTHFELNPNDNRCIVSPLPSKIFG